MKVVSKYSWLNFIPLTDFELWDVKRYTQNVSLEGENFVLLRNILNPVKESVSKSEMIKNHWHIISKINFNGELFLRNFEEIKNYKGNLFLVPENSIIYSKINVRHGCIYYNENGNNPFGVSSEYPVFTFDETRVDGRFLIKLLRTQMFKNLLNTKTSGISKARVKSNEFLNIKIPLPTLTEQQNLVAAYDKKINEAADLENKAALLEKEIEKFLFDKLEIKLPQKNNEIKSLQFVDFTAISRWDSLFLLGQIDQIKSNFKIQKFGEIINNFNKLNNGKSLRISSFKQPDTVFRYIGMENVEKESGKLIEFQIVKGNNVKSQTIKVPKDFFIYGKLRPYLNKYWLNETDYKNIICSSEFFVFDIDKRVLNKDFFLYILSSQIIQTQISDKTSGARMPRINEDIFFNLQFPMPGIDEQTNIAHRISTSKSLIDMLMKKSENLRILAENEFEQSNIQSK